MGYRRQMTEVELETAHGQTAREAADAAHRLMQTVEADEIALVQSLIDALDQGDDETVTAAIDEIDTAMIGWTQDRMAVSFATQIHLAVCDAWIAWNLLPEQKAAAAQRRYEADVASGHRRPRVSRP